jgi:septum formation protein
MSKVELANPEMRLVLASQSPRRVQLMREAGYEFEIVVPEVEEAHDGSLSPEDLTVENARRKAVAGAVLHPDALVIGADTLVYLDSEPLGKPANLDEALTMLRRLSGRSHEVCTGVYLAWDAGRQGRGFHVISHVVFKTLSDDLIRAYHALVNPLDKAGAYGIQENGNMIISGHEGSWTNVMGLPMERLTEELEKSAS